MTLAGLKIRVASAEDLAGLIALERRTVKAPHWNEAEYAAIIRDRSEDAVRRCVFVAEADTLLGFAVGKVILSAGHGVGEIESVAVDATARRLGVGRALCAAVLTWCSDRGAVEMELEVRAGSSGAIALYEGLGFVAVGRRAQYYRNPEEDAVLMQLKLGGGG